MAEQRVRSLLVALLLETLRAHGPEEAMRRQRDVCSARSCRRPALGTQATRHADAALQASAGLTASCLRPSVLVLAAGMCGRDGRGTGRRQAGLARRPCHAQDATAAGVALLFGCRHCLVVAIEVCVVTSCMSSAKGREARVRRIQEK